MSDDQAMRDAPASRSARQPRARLRAVHPSELRWAIELGPRPAELGRVTTEGGPPPLIHGTVSRRHFEVRWDEHFRRHVGRDLGSHNGSRVDGRDLGPTTAMLASGSVIQLGDVSLVYEEIPADAPASPPAEPLIHGDSPAIAGLVGALDRAARGRSPVLLAGEIGTGKEHIARALHRRSGRSGPLRVFDCSAVPHRGPVGDAWGLLGTAAGGTLYLDEIAELPSSLQLELARALADHEAGPLDVRVVAATHHELAERVAAGRLRRDLYACLTRDQAPGVLRVPPLRERRGDVLSWLERLHTAWLERRPTYPVRTLALLPEAAERLLLHGWPGNLHELGRVVHELAADPDLPRPIPLHRLPAWLLGGTPDVPTQPVSGPPASRRANHTRG